MAYPEFPMQYPVNPEGIAPIAHIPVELNIEGIYEDHDCRRKNGSDKVVTSQMHSVYARTWAIYLQKLIMSSVAEPRTENRNGHFETERKSTGENSSNGLANSRVATLTSPGHTRFWRLNTQMLSKSWRGSAKTMLDLRDRAACREITNQKSG